VGTFLQDLRYGFRTLGKLPGYIIIAMLTLALGIGANTAIFSIVYSVILAPLPYPHPEQLVMVWSKLNGERNRVSPGDFLDWERESSAFQSLSAWTGASFDLSGGGAVAQEVDGELMSPDFLRTSGGAVHLGRTFRPDESEAGKNHVVILAYKFWQSRFGSDPSIVGKQIHLDREPYTVVGVLAPGEMDRTRVSVLMPLTFSPEQINHKEHWLWVVARMRPGVTAAQAEADMRVVAQHIAAAHPDDEKNRTVSVEPLHDDWLPAATITELWLFLGAVGFVLLIACVNVANLMLSRAATREREIAVRAALGAGRFRIFRQLLTESVLLAILGGACGIALSEIILRGILAMVPVYTFPSEADFRMHVPVLLFTLTATILAGVVFGTAPAWQASRLNLNESLKDGGRSSMATGSRGVRRALVVVEFAMALCLMTGAGLAIRSFQNLTNEDLGVRTDRILTFTLRPSPHHFSNVVQITAYFRQILASVEAVPGITHASSSGNLPDRHAFELQFGIAGRLADQLGSNPMSGLNVVSPEYFSTFGVRLDRGRAFDERDVAEGAQVAMVNEAFVRRYFANVDPLTQQVLVPQFDPFAAQMAAPVARQIVGIFHDVRNMGPRQADVPEINVPFWQYPLPFAAVAVHTSSDPRNAIKDVAAAVQSVDPDLPLTQVQSMQQIVSLTLAGDRWITVLYAGFGFAALLLAILGVYGVMSYSVAQRTHEIGIRMALGAARMDVLRLILKEGLLLAGIGVVAGTAGALALTRLMRSSLFGVSATDPVIFAGVAMLLVAVGVAGCLVPAQRAMRVDPLVALRHE
jgi:putative ABC transport system permease protein